MNVFFNDMKIDNFIASEYSLMPVSFDTNIQEDCDASMASESIEDYIGISSIPLDYGSNHHGKLVFVVTFMKKICGSNIEEYFTDFEIRSILRELTGRQYYRNLYFINTDPCFDEKVHFKVKTTGTEYVKSSNKIIALKFTFTCDSFWAYTDTSFIEYFAKPNQTIKFFNSSDELNDYLYPVIEILSKKTIENYSIVNKSDNNRLTNIKNVLPNEVILLDSKNDIIKSSIETKVFGDDFNYKFPRLIPGMNELEISDECNIKITYQLLRKIIF